MFKFSFINPSIGIKLRSLNNSLLVNRRFIAYLQGVLLLIFNDEDIFLFSPRKLIHNFSELTAKMTPSGKMGGAPRLIFPTRHLYMHIRTIFGSSIIHVF
jgi:hypothetical protein